MEQISAHHFYRTRLFLFTLCIVVLGAALAGAGVFFLLPSGLGEGYSAIISTIQGIESILLQKTATLYVVIAVGIVIAMVVLHLFYSHRVAGPAFRLGKEAARLGEGNLAGNVRFRQKDNLTEMADTLNDVAGRYRARVEAVKNHLSLIEAQSEALSVLIQQGNDGPAMEKAADDIAVNIRQMDKLFSEMRT